MNLLAPHTHKNEYVKYSCFFQFTQYLLALLNIYSNLLTLVQLSKIYFRSWPMSESSCSVGTLQRGGIEAGELRTMWLWKYTCTSFSKNRVPVPDKARYIYIYIYCVSLPNGILSISKWWYNIENLVCPILWYITIIPIIANRSNKKYVSLIILYLLGTKYKISLKLCIQFDVQYKMSHDF